MTTTLDIRSETKAYKVTVGQGVHASAGADLLRLGVSTQAKVFIVCDDTTKSLGYGNAIAASARASGYEAFVCSVPPGDESKSLDTAVDLYNQMLDFGVRRSGVVVAVGGGVVGDLAGFVAATYLRGVGFIQSPTTLLAHDSSIGGKVGVNLPRGKNLIGAFYPPLAVWYDVQTLTTLPNREWRGGMAEVIKHGILGDAALFQRLEQEPLLTCPDASACESLLVQAMGVKVDIVERDEHESDLRMLLNLGHTVGHAVELTSHYELNHGECVAIGISVETQVAVSRGWLTREDQRRIRAVLADHGLPIVPPDFNYDDIERAIQVDKKHASALWTLALPRGIGQADVCRDVIPTEVQNAWTQTREELSRP